jgi:hypothetical protein
MTNARWMLPVFLLLALTPIAQGQSKQPIPVYLTSDCEDSVGSQAASAFREKIRGSNGYVLASEPTKGHSGWEILLTCAAVPGHETGASAVSYVFDAFLPDDARYFVTPGVGVVGTDRLDKWAQILFSQFDNWVGSVQKVMK